MIIWLILLTMLNISYAQLPYLVKEPSTNENLEFLMNEINGRGIDNNGCIYAPTLCVNPSTFRVGIGTRTPLRKLHIASGGVCINDDVAGCDATLADPTLQLSRTTGSDATILFNHEDSTWTIGARNGGGFWISS